MLDRQSMLRRRKSVTLEEAAEMLTGIEGWNKENRAAIDLMRESIQHGELEPESVHYWDEDAWTFDGSRAVLDQHATTVTVANFEAWRARTFRSADALQQAVTAMGQATDNPPRVSGEAMRPSRTACSGSRSASVVVLINGREAIPVRTIPYITGRWMSPDVVAKSLACHDAMLAFENVRAYALLLGGSYSALRPKDWDEVEDQLEGLEARLEAMTDDRRVTRPIWLNESTPLLSAGVFLWKDEFEQAYQRRYSAAALVWLDERPEDRELNYTPPIPEALHAVVMDGFEQTERMQEDAKSAVSGKPQDQPHTVPSGAPARNHNPANVQVVIVLPKSGEQPTDAYRAEEARQKAIDHAELRRENERSLRAREAEAPPPAPVEQPVLSDSSRSGASKLLPDREGEQAGSLTPDERRENHDTATATKEPRSGITKKELLAVEWPLSRPFSQESLERVLSDVPGWLIPARVSRGSPGKASALWDPALVACCLVVQKHSNQKALNRFIRRHFSDWIAEWEECREKLADQ